MISFPVKGDASKDYAGGANPAELGWYFLLPAMDSGFGYYDENKDDDVKPTLAFNNSLAFTKPYVTANLTNDHTGPSVWWPQRYPYNPGSVNASKAEGWTVQHYSSDFAIYTYAYDVSGIASMKVMIRPHTSTNIDASDDTYKVYDPASMVGKPGLSITPSNVGAWVAYPMQVRDLKPVMNGVDWVQPTKDTLQVLPAQEIGNLYYAYLRNYRNQLLDYYVEATDTKGNGTKSEIQQVYVGAGTYTATGTGSGYVEDTNGTVQGVYPFLVVDTTAPGVPGTPTASSRTDRSVSLSWTAATDDVGVTGYQVFRNGTMVGTTATNSYTDTGLTASTRYSYQVLAYDAAGNQSATSGTLSVTTQAPDIVAPTAPGTPTASGVTPSSVTLSWTAATDNYGVAQYDVFRNATPAGSTATTTYTDTGLTPATAYSYTVKAQDAAGNLSPASGAKSVTTQAGNVVTVYYKHPTGWSTVNIHYAPTGGSWTNVPGVPMTASCTGWDAYTIDLGSATGAQVVLNNGSGTWDNNSGKNYTIGTGIAALENGAVTGGTNPCTEDTQAPSVPSALTGSAIDANTVSLSWTASTDNVGVAAYHVLRGGTQFANVTTGTSYTDSTVSPSTTYSYTVAAYDAAGNVSAASTAQSVTTPAKTDTQAPTVPTGLGSSNVGSSGATISWTASSDNVGVATYLVFRNDAQIASTAATSYTDSGLSASTTYSYKVKAQDAVGNLSAASTALSVTTTAVGGNTATVYYKYPTDWSTVNIHYAPKGGNWTAVPGVAMHAACSGWRMKSINLGSATELQVVLNDGSGTWDNNNGANYSLGTSISAIQNGSIGTSNPCTGVDTAPPSTPTGLGKGPVTGSSVAVSWTASTDNVGVTGYKVLRNATQIGTTTSTGYTDTSVAANTTYTYTVQAYDAAGNVSAASSGLSVTTPAASCQYTFTIANANTVMGQNLYVVGNQTVLGNWAPGSGFALTIQGSGANVPWSGTVTLPAGTAIQYKYVKWNGSTAVWESHQSTSSGNRELTTPASCSGTVSQNDGNFRF